MAKATTSRVIVFDLDEALAFEGETGPYLQYSLVRGRNIQRKLAAAGLPAELDPAAAAALPEELWSDDLWELVHRRRRHRGGREGGLDPEPRSSPGTLELAQRFHALYHHHPVLHEEDPALAVCQTAFQTAMRAFGGFASCSGSRNPKG